MTRQQQLPPTYVGAAGASRGLRKSCFARTSGARRLTAGLLSAERRASSTHGQAHSPCELVINRRGFCGSVVVLVEVGFWAFTKTAILPALFDDFAMMSWPIPYFDDFLGKKFWYKLGVRLRGTSAFRASCSCDRTRSFDCPVFPQRESFWLH